MGFLDKIIKFKNYRSNVTYETELEERLSNNHIPYEIEEFGGKLTLSYIDPFCIAIYDFENLDGLFYLNGREVSEKEVFRLMEAKWKVDEILIKYMEDETYCDIFDIMDFFDNMTSENGLIGKMSPLKDKKGIKLYYNIGTIPTEKEYLAGIELKESKDNTAIFFILPSGMQTDANGAILYILGKIYEEAPLFFNSGAYAVKTDSRFADIVKTYLMNLEMIARLNKVEGVESQITDVGRNNNIFVMFKNGSAIEYISPTKQSPSGSLLIIDYDDANHAEDNDGYILALRILKLSSMIKDKPDENKMPKREFSNKRPGGRIK